MDTQKIFNHAFILFVGLATQSCGVAMNDGAATIGLASAFQTSNGAQTQEWFCPYSPNVTGAQAGHPDYSVCVKNGSPSLLKVKPGSNAPRALCVIAMNDSGNGGEPIAATRPETRQVAYECFTQSQAELLVTGFSAKTGSSAVNFNAVLIIDQADFALWWYGLPVDSAYGAVK